LGSGTNKIWLVIWLVAGLLAKRAPVVVGTNETKIKKQRISPLLL